ncbi:MAG: LytTR family DNA-binding domain-containing protein [Acholeplasmataceae bacterium]
MIKIVFSKEDAKQLFNHFQYLSQLEVIEEQGDSLSIVFNEQDYEILKEVFDYIQNDRTQLVFQTPSGYAKVPVYEITYFESFGNEVDLHTLSLGKITIKEPLYQLEELLAPHHFVRISKSYIVNLKKVVFIRTTLNAKLDLELNNRTHLQVSRSYVRQFKQKLDIK